MSPDIWNPRFDTLHPCFQQLQNVRCWDGREDWPACEDLAGLLPAGLRAQSGLPITFVPQDDTLPFPDLYYEERIFQHGMVSTRPNWHDFFNALMWNVYPRSKVMINALHAADISQYGKPRTPQRDALTVLDESGVLIVASRRALLQHVLDFAWERLFWEERAAWEQEVSCYMIGHATLEKMLTPYIGVTAHALLVEVEPAFFSLSLAQQHAYLDAVVGNTLQQGGLASTACLNPLPLLGVPGWWDNASQAFYRNKAYFRDKSRERAVQIIAPA
ncbi:DUF3025 domain-containing protein [Thiothrix litoralis]|uniref:DUF3025 domain-containing protein n=1 Tax=Thiothrix litoralis TaxID=2891210 RepID=A0ABX7WP59_9GAMM|nr:DUF3025 domain-containing protein [Thiothrix litoralis]QTR44892.1 DUF3025 domain-containing protein [Thiothrix litoralis]